MKTLNLSRNLETNRSSLSLSLLFLFPLPSLSLPSLPLASLKDRMIVSRENTEIQRCLYESRTVIRESEQESNDELKDQPFSINDFPDEVLISIFSFFSLIDLSKAKRICRRWNLLAHSNSLWTTHYIHSFWDGNPPPCSQRSSPLGSPYCQCRAFQNAARNYATYVASRKKAESQTIETEDLQKSLPRHFPKNRRIGVFGSSKVGKTTIISLLCNLPMAFVNLDNPYYYLPTVDEQTFNCSLRSGMCFYFDLPGSLGDRSEEPEHMSESSIHGHQQSNVEEMESDQDLSLSNQKSHRHSRQRDSSISSFCVRIHLINRIYRAGRIIKKKYSCGKGIDVALIVVSMVDRTSLKEAHDFWIPLVKRIFGSLSPCIIVATFVDHWHRLEWQSPHRVKVEELVQLLQPFHRSAVLPLLFSPDSTGFSLPIEEIAEQLVTMSRYTSNSCPLLNWPTPF